MAVFCFLSLWLWIHASGYCKGLIRCTHFFFTMSMWLAIVLNMYKYDCISKNWKTLKNSLGQFTTHPCSVGHYLGFGIRELFGGQPLTDMRAMCIHG